MKKWIGFMLVLTLAFSVFTPNTYAQGYKDLSPDYRFYDEVNYLTEKEIISGFLDNTFRANRYVTRAQAAIMIGRTFGLDGTPADTPFWDVVEDTFASGYTNSVYEAGIITGYRDRNYRPNKIVTRGEMAIILSRAFKLTEEAELPFPDVKPHMKSYSYIKRIVAENITEGFPDGTFRPEEEMRRGEFSAFLARAMDNQFKK
ncbi:S-layer homology domain-containing protein [Cytobacillus sp.]|uniref:S-layer homology domain-containing protein n=1 Tax=Cytobacillus sp. TaxID=2675269 RepID=UPI003516DFCB